MCRFPRPGAALQGERVDPGRNPSAGWLLGVSAGTLSLSIAVIGAALDTRMRSLKSFPRSCRQGIRSIVSVSLCAALPMPPQESPPRAPISRQADGGPGWYESSWELVHGLEIAEVPDVEAELALWIEACLNQAPSIELA
jgi:hypothetical protein